jgi:hypothetical protein
MSINQKFKFVPPVVVIRIIFVFLAALIIFSFYKLFFLSGASVIVMLVIASILVIVIAYSFKEASGRLIVKARPEINGLKGEALRSWAEKQYILMNLFLFSGLIAAFGLFSLGAMPMVSVIFYGQRDIIDYFLSGFGATIFCIGVYFIIIASNELKFTLKKKEIFVNKLIEQVEILQK